MEPRRIQQKESTYGGAGGRGRGVLPTREIEMTYGFFSTIFPFSQTQIGVPYIRAIFRARRAAAGIARFTDSKNLWFSGEGLVRCMALARSVAAFLLSYRTPSTNPRLVCRALGNSPNFAGNAGPRRFYEFRGPPAGSVRRSAAEQLRGRKGEIDYFDAISGFFPILQPGDLAEAAERTLERKINAAGGEPIGLGKEQPARTNRGQPRPERREPARDQIRIDEMHDSRKFREKLLGESGLTRAVRPSNQDTSWCVFPPAGLHSKILPALRHSYPGNRSRATHPGPSVRFSSISAPPWPSAICRLNTSPMPEPPGLVVKNGTKRLAVPERPGPSS